MVVVVVLCGFAARCPAAIVHYGNDGSDGAFSEPYWWESTLPNYLIGSKYTVTQPIVLQKAGIIFGSAITNAKVGIYTDAGGAPDTLVAETGLFEVYIETQLETPLLTTPTIPAGDYWFMAVYDAVETPVDISYDDSAQVAYIAHTFNSPLPATFPAPIFYTGVAFAYYLVGETTLSGDYNGNGRVDAADYTVWRNTVGSANDFRADGTGPDGVPDHVIDRMDYNFWKQHYGEGAGSGAATEAVPEPASWVAVALAAFGLTLVLDRRFHCARARDKLERNSC